MSTENNFLGFKAFSDQFRLLVDNYLMLVKMKRHVLNCDRDGSLLFNDLLSRIGQLSSCLTISKRRVPETLETTPLRSRI